jgi:hypothetical protein
MNLIFTVPLTALLAAPPPSECEVGDNLCDARRFEQLAATTRDPGHRALRLHGAYRSYLALYTQTRQAEHLCAARRMYDRSVAIAGVSPERRANFEAAEADLLAQERQRDVRCERKAKPRPRELATGRGARSAPAFVELAPPPVDVNAEPTTSSGEGPSSTAIPLVVAATEQPVVPATEPTLPANDLPSRPPALPPDADAGRTVRPAPQTFLPTPPRHPRAHDARPPGRGLVIAGGVALGAGLALAGVAAYAGHRTLAVHRAAGALLAEVDGFATDEQLAREAQLAHDYRQLAPQALGFAAASGATLVVSAVLLGVGGRRMARAAARTSLVPVPGGLAFHARF